jgi:hypothetical protein
LRSEVDWYFQVIRNKAEAPRCLKKIVHRPMWQESGYIFGTIPTYYNFLYQPPIDYFQKWNWIYGIR